MPTFPGADWTFSTPLSSDTGHRVSTDLTVASHDNLATAIEEIQAVVRDLLAASLGTALLYIRYTGSTVPLRNTVTTDLTRTVVWICPSTAQPTTDTGYFVAGVDVIWAIVT